MFFILCSALIVAMATSLRAEMQARRDHAAENPFLATGEEAQFSVSGALTVAGIIVGAVVGLAVLSALAPLWFDSVGDLSENFSTADTGSETANGIANNIFPLIIGLTGVFAIAGLAFAAMKLRK